MIKIRFLTYFSILVLPVLLAGCVERQNTAIISSTAARPTGPLTVNKTVQAGKSIEINHITSVNPDCTPAAMGDIRIDQQPSHGTAVITKGESYPSFPPVNQRYACNKTKSPSLILTYTPDPGFVGSDLLVEESFSPTGDDGRVVNVLITVK